MARFKQFLCLLGFGFFSSKVMATGLSLLLITASFGNYDPLSGTNDDIITPITITNNGAGSVSGRLYLNCPNNNGTNRQMAKLTPSVDEINYNYYTNAARTNVFGGAPGSGGCSLAPATGNSIPVTVPGFSSVTVNIYARAFAGQDVSVGNYQDDLVITLQY